MQWETLPNWIWAVYYLFFIITLVTAIFSIVKRDKKSWSVAAFVFTITVPIVSLISSIGRTEGMNEFEYLVSQLQQGAVWSIFVWIGYFFLLGWWSLFLFKIRLIK
ncbi:hypothetical protein SAMN05421743_101406 [Thalassobacillus cyri]|uniref:Transmembrane protein n=1 Tax=Thalassobacillus cyri TaxID=571932 RepID=A0A1H3WD36_9BACI|nr:hypothetical protein [Thalassobacillus cyri]SDZ84741.1 hypothetical protein SAMN05421743_101406 [Thalassobacillus cyri]